MPQALEVTVTAGTEIYIEISPAVNTSIAQKIGIVRAGDDQTIEIRPVE